MEFENGSKTPITDDWKTSDDPRARNDSFKVGQASTSVPTGKKLVGKQSILKPPEPLEVKPKKVQDSKLQIFPPPTSQPSNPLAAEYTDTFRGRLFQALADDGSYGFVAK